MSKFWTITTVSIIVDNFREVDHFSWNWKIIDSAIFLPCHFLIQLRSFSFIHQLYWFACLLHRYIWSYQENCNCFSVPFQRLIVWIKATWPCPWLNFTFDNCSSSLTCQKYSWQIQFKVVLFLKIQNWTSFVNFAILFPTVLLNRISWPIIFQTTFSMHLCPICKSTCKTPGPQYQHTAL